MTKSDAFFKKYLDSLKLAIRRAEEYDLVGWKQSHFRKQSEMRVIIDESRPDNGKAKYSLAAVLPAFVWQCYFSAAI